MNQTESVTLDAMLATGASYRQIDYWAQRGYLKPVQEKQGSGNNRSWPASEREIARIMMKLLGVGVELARAAQYARRAVETGAPEIDLGNGLMLTIATPESSEAQA